MSKVKCEVMYFKESGKYYAEVEHEIPDNVKSFEVSDYINFIEEVPDGDRAYGIMSRVIKEVSKGSAVDDAFNNICGIHALNEFNRLPS